MHALEHVSLTTRAHVQRLYVVESFSLPSEALSRVIGKGGAMLRELQDRTHAKIDLPRVRPGPLPPRRPALFSLYVFFSSSLSFPSPFSLFYPFPPLSFLRHAQAVSACL